MAQPEARYTIKASDSTKAAVASAMAGLKSVGDSANSLKSQMLALAGVGGFGALITVSLQSADALAKTADKLGVTTESLAAMHQATRLLTSAGVEDMNKALTEATKRLGDFNATGGGPAARWLKQLQLDTRELADLSPDKLFEKYADAIKGAGDRGQQLAAMSALMGEESTRLIGIVDAGGQAFEASSKQVEVFGLAISRVDAAKIEAANDSMTNVGQAVKGLGTQIGIHLSPIIEYASNQLVAMAADAGGMAKIVTNAFNVVIDAIALAANAFRGLQVVWKGIEVAFAVFIESIILKLNDLNNTGAALLSWIPGLNVKPNAAISEWAIVARNRVEELKTEFSDLVNEPLPADNVKKWFGDIEAAMTKAAVATAEAKAKLAEDNLAAPQDTKLQDDATRARLSKELDALRDHFATKRELLQQDTDNKEFTIEEAFQTQLINEQTRNDLMLSLEIDHQKRLTEISIEEANNRARAEDIVTSARYRAFELGAQLLDQFAGKSKAAAIASIAINKGLAIAHTVQNTARAVMGITASMSTLGPAAPAAIATEVAKVKALGALQIGLIAGSGLAQAAGLGGGGGYGGGGGGGGGGSPGAQPLANIPDIQTAKERKVTRVSIVGARAGDLIDSADLARVLEEAVDADEITIEVNGDRAEVYRA